MPILSAEERVGRTLDGKYEIGAPIATGGMGVVYRGKHTWTGRDVAIKVLLPEHSLDPETSRRFLTEARASASLRHPNVVDVLDMGRDEDGSLYMVLELLEGRDLEEVLDERQVLAPAEAITAVAPALEALAFAHAKGFVHRDIKPSNLFLASDARGTVTVKVLDFGIAKALDGGANKATRTGVIIGTPHYMAPEQASGVGVIGPATDTWSMGIVLYRALTGVFPFDGASPTIILMNVLGKRAAPVCSVRRDLPGALGEIVDQMLEPDADARPGDLKVLAKQLRALLPAGSEEVLTLATLAKPRTESASSVASAPTAILSAQATEPSLPRVERTEPHTRRLATRHETASPRHRSWLAMGVGAAVVVGLAGVWWWASQESHIPQSPRAEHTEHATEQRIAEPTVEPTPAPPAEPQPAPQPVGVTATETRREDEPDARRAPSTTPVRPTPRAASSAPSPPTAPVTSPVTPLPSTVPASPPEEVASAPREPDVRREQREPPPTLRPITEIQEEF